MFDLEGAVSAVVAFLVYFNIIDGEFVFDDRRAIVHNDDVITSQRSMWRLFSNDFWGTSLSNAGSHQSYRPITVLSFRVNYLLFGLDASKFHLVNILLHSVVTYVFCCVATRVCAFDRKRKLVSGLLFAVHPIHTEAVAGLVGRADILATLFFLLSLTCYDRQVRADDERTKPPQRREPSVVESANNNNSNFTTINQPTFRRRKKPGKRRKTQQTSKCEKNKKRLITKGKIDSITASQVTILDSNSKSNNRLHVHNDMRRWFEMRTNQLISSTSTTSAESSSHSETSSICSCSSEESVENNSIRRRNFIHDCGGRKSVASTFDERSDEGGGGQCCDNRIKQPPLFSRRSSNCHWLFSAYAFAVLSLLSKEQGFCTLFVCLAYDLFVHSRLGPRGVINALIGKNGGEKQPSSASSILRQRTLCTISFSLIIVTIRLLLSSLIASFSAQPLHFTPSFSAFDNPAAAHPIAKSRWLTFNYLAARHFFLLLLPRPLCYDWSMGSIPLIHKFSDPRNVLTLAFLVLLVAAVVKVVASLLRKDVEGKEQEEEMQMIYEEGNGNDDEHDENCFIEFQRSTTDLRTNERSPNFDSNLCVSTAILILSFLPATNLFFYVGFVIAERILYMTSVGSCILATDMLFALKQHNLQMKRYLTCAFWISLLLVFSLFSNQTWTRNRDWRNEFELYKSGVSHNPAKSWASLGNIYKLRGRFDEAESAYTEALRHEAGMPDTYYNLGLLHYEQKRYQDAERCYRKALLYRPHMALGHLNLGVLLAAQGRNDEAKEAYLNATVLSEVVTRDPSSHAHARISAHYNIGNLLSNENLYEEAILHYNTAIKLTHLWPRYEFAHKIYNMLGQAHHLVGNRDKSEMAFKSSLQINSTHSITYLMYGKLSSEQMFYEKADQLFERAKYIDPENPMVYLHHSDDLMQRGHEDKALMLLERAATTFAGKQNYEVNLQAATSFRRYKKLKKAEHFYRNCIRIDSLNPTAHSNLGAFLHLIGRLKEAEQSYQKALKLSSGKQPLAEENLKKLWKQMKSTSSKTSSVKDDKGG